MGRTLCEGGCARRRAKLTTEGTAARHFLGRSLAQGCASNLALSMNLTKTSSTPGTIPYLTSHKIRISIKSYLSLHGLA